MLAKGGYRGYYGFEWEKAWHPEIEEPEVAFPHYAEFMRRALADARNRGETLLYSAERALAEFGEMLSDDDRTAVAMDVDDARRALDLGACRVVNVKVGRVGGFSSALAVHDACRARTAAALTPRCHGVDR